MRIKPALGSVVGVADSNHWGQVFLSPTAYGVVEVEDRDGRARDWGVKVLSNLSACTVSPPRSLKHTQEAALKAYEDRVVSLALLIPIGKTVSLVLLGEGQVLLKRGNRIATLMDGPGAISGEVQQGDTLVLMTKSVGSVLSREEITSLFDHLDAPAIAENMTMALHRHEAGTGGAALIVHIGKLTPVEEEEPAAAPTNGKRPVLQRVILSLRRRPMAIVTASLASLFFISIVFGFRRQMGRRLDADVARVLTDAQHAYEEGVALLELNPVKGRERIAAARDALAPVRETLSPSSAQGKAVAKLYKEVMDRLAIAMQVHRVEPALFYEFSLLKPNATITSVGQRSDAVAILDGNAPSVAVLSPSTKKGEIVAGGESYRGARLLTMHGDSVFVLVPDGIHRASVQDKETATTVIRKDDQWGSIASIGSYGGNIYLLDTEKGRIWKYVAAGDGFSEMREYLNPDTLPDLSRGTGMAIDGGLWIGTKDGKILRFMGGREETFTPRGVEPGLGKTLVVATTEEDRNLYVLDQDNKRVVVLDKDGVYLAQYVWTGTLMPTQLVVFEKLKLLLLLADGKLYSIALK